MVKVWAPGAGLIAPVAQMTGCARYGHILHILSRIPLLRLCRRLKVCSVPA